MSFGPLAALGVTIRARPSTLDSRLSSGRYTFLSMLRLARFRRLSGLCCVLAGLVAATPALPCILLCANHAHLQHASGSHGPMHNDGPGHGSAPSAPAPLPCTGHHVPAPLASVVQVLTAAAMYPSTSMVVLAEPVAQRTGQHHAPVLRATPGLPPVPPPPRSA